MAGARPVVAARRGCFGGLYVGGEEARTALDWFEGFLERTEASCLANPYPSEAGVCCFSLNMEAAAEAVY